MGAFSQFQNSNQFDLLSTARSQNPKYQILLIRFMPQLNIENEINNAQVQALWSGAFLSTKHFQEQFPMQQQSTYKNHRAWVRYITNQHELKLGLQKVYFGPAKILRSLQWFDQIQHDDITQFTAGVNGLLYRYYGEDNNTLWLWTWENNKALLGPLPLKATNLEPEWGGRYQSMLETGEYGVSIHRRKLEKNNRFMASLTEEIRLGFDMIWDLAFAGWIEVNLSYLKGEQNSPAQYTAVTMGLDYTLNWRQGIYLLLESQFTELNLHSGKKENWQTIFKSQYPLSFSENVGFLFLRGHSSEEYRVQMNYGVSFDQSLIELALGYDSSKNPLDLSKKTASNFASIVGQYNF